MGGAKGAAEAEEDRKRKREELERERERKKEEEKSLSKFMTLKTIELQVKKGEFLCIIGDVGSGKSSLLSSIIGDLIYVP